jgi:integrase/recombinase XerD
MIKSYCRWWRTTGRAASTLVNYRYTLERLADRLGGEHRLAAATLDDLEDYLDHRLATTSPGTASVDFRALRSFYGWLAAQGDIDRNPSTGLHSPKVAMTPVRVATETDYRRLVATCPKTTKAGRRDAAILAVLWATGARRGELAGLDLDSVDLDAGTISIGRTKNGTPRRVPLDVDAVAALDRWLRAGTNGRGYEPGPLFVAEHGGRLTSNGIGQMFQRRCETAGVDVTAHTFRRALATRWLRAGGGETALRAVTGWRSPAMVERYTRMNAEELAHAEYRRLFG